LAARREEGASPQGAVTDEQRSGRPKDRPSAVAGIYEMACSINQQSSDIIHALIFNRLGILQKSRHPHRIPVIVIRLAGEGQARCQSRECSARYLSGRAVNAPALRPGYRRKTVAIAVTTRNSLPTDHQDPCDHRTADCLLGYGTDNQ
jgi:hypothetical protein